MNEPHRILMEYLLNFRHPEKAASLFADGGVFEMPYLVSLGIEPRHEGPTDVQRLISGVLELYPDWRFDANDVSVLIDTPTQAFAEYIAHPTAAATGRKVHHLLMGMIEVENGQIKRLREALNTLASAQALLEHGAADVAPPGMEISSY